MPTLGDRCILIVEDAPILALDLEHELHDRGAKVTIASTLDKAFAKLEEGDCDAAVVDHQLGREMADPLYEELKGRNIPFIISTGSSASRFAEQDVPVVQKPVNIAELVTALEDILRPETAEESQVPCMCNQTTNDCA